MILVSGYAVLTAVNWSQHWCAKCVQYQSSCAPKLARKCGADGRSLGRAGGLCTVTWLPNFLGWVVYFIFLPMVLRCARLARRSPAINLVCSVITWKSQTSTLMYWPHLSVNTSRPWFDFPVTTSHSVDKPWNNTKQIFVWTGNKEVQYTSLTNVLLCCCLFADLPSLTTLSWVSRFHDLYHALTNWQLISHAFPKSQTPKKFVRVAFDYILLAYRDLPLPPNGQTYCFSCFRMAANKT